MSLLLGIDEGTSAVKAVVFDGDLKPVNEARREKPLIHPKPGWVEQDPEVIVDAVGESVLAWDAETGKALTTVVTWQDKRSQEILDRLEADGKAELILKASGMPLDPYFSAGKLAWLLENDDAVA